MSTKKKEEALEQKEENWECVFPNCGKKYTLESSLYNHVRIKHPEKPRNACIKNDQKKKIGRPRIYFPSEEMTSPEIDITSQNYLTMREFYTNPLWAHLTLELRDYISGHDIEKALKNKESLELISQVEKLVKSLSMYQEDLLLMQSSQNVDFFLRQLNYFSRNLDTKKICTLSACNCIVLIWLLCNSSNTYYYQDIMKHLHQISEQNESLINKICKAFCTAQNNGSCQYKLNMNRIKDYQQNHTNQQQTESFLDDIHP